MIHIESLPHLHAREGQRVVELPMSAEDRRRVHRRITAADGAELALDLPTGTILGVGQIIHREGEADYVITAAPEDVLLIAPRDWREGAFVGHLIGNLHRDIDLEGDGVAVLWDAPLERRLAKAGLHFERTERPFHGKPPGEHSH